MIVPDSEPHHQRQAAESFGSDPERHDRARPRYPDVLIERIVASAPGRVIRDVGVGTGGLGRYRFGLGSPGGAAAGVIVRVAVRVWR
jgi:hypothetical protein